MPNNFHYYRLRNIFYNESKAFLLLSTPTSFVCSIKSPGPDEETFAAFDWYLVTAFFFLFASASSLPSCCDLLDLFNELWLLWYTWVWLAMLSNQVIEVMHWLFFLFCIIFITVGNGNCDVACLLCKFNLRWCSNRFDKKTFAFASIDKNHYFERRNLCLKRDGGLLEKAQSDIGFDLLHYFFFSFENMTFELFSLNQTCLNNAVNINVQRGKFGEEVPRCIGVEQR